METIEIKFATDLTDEEKINTQLNMTLQEKIAKLKRDKNKHNSIFYVKSIEKLKNNDFMYHFLIKLHEKVKKD